MGTRLQGILSRRVLRDLKSNFWRYLALLLLITLGMYMVVAMIGSAESIMWTVETSYEENLGEDGQFGTFVPLSEEEWGQITGKGVTLEEHFSLDYEVGETRIRVMKARSQIDLFEVETGRNLEQDGEMLLEKLYAAANGLEIGSEVTLQRSRQGSGKGQKHRQSTIGNRPAPYPVNPPAIGKIIGSHGKQGHDNGIEIGGLFIAFLGFQVICL